VATQAAIGGVTNTETAVDGLTTIKGSTTVSFVSIRGSDLFTTYGVEYI
jgi:hypothetical protein